MKDVKDLRENFNNSNFYSRRENKDNSYSESWYSLDFDRGFPEGETRIINLVELKKALEDVVKRIDEARNANPDLNYVVVDNKGFTPDYKVREN